MKLHFLIATAATLLPLGESNVWAQGFGGFVPGDSVVEANSSTSHPFSTPSSRFQQLYGIQNLFAQDVWFNDLVFRLDGVNGSTINGQTMNIQVRMSTTSRAIDSLSPVFADNIGLDQATVFNGTVQWFSNFVPGSQFPQASNLRINLQQPFLYRPSGGNLLVDFTVNGTTIFSQFDAWNRVGDPVSSVFGSSGSLSGTPSTLGLVTLIEGAVVPEPSTYALLFLGIVAFAFMRQKRR